MKEEALKDFLYKMADDQLIIGHRNSEWTGLGPLLEEDIAFSSMAQDKLGQCYTLYSMLSNIGESDPDNIAFMRNAEQFHNCQFVELPIGEVHSLAGLGKLLELVALHLLLRRATIFEEMVRPLCLAAGQTWHRVHLRGS